jgi:hypothetical protein
VADPGVEVSGQHLVEGQARFGKDRLFGQPPFAEGFVEACCRIAKETAIFAARSTGFDSVSLNP